MALTIYVAETSRSYGIGTSETEAVLTMAWHYHGNVPDDGEKVMLAEAKGYEGGELFEVDADEVIRRDMMVIPKDHMEQLIRRANERADDDILVEEAVEAASELEW